MDNLLIFNQNTTQNNDKNKESEIVKFFLTKMTNKAKHNETLVKNLNTTKTNSLKKYINMN